MSRDSNPGSYTRRHFWDDVALLLKYVPKVTAAVPKASDRLQQLDEWQALHRRYHSINPTASADGDADHPPGRLNELMLVATLYGPTGAGKSTLFRLLTQVEVPAGGITRPLSRGTAAAVPESIDEATLARLFPGCALHQLENPDDLKADPQTQSGAEKLYWRHYSLPAEPASDPAAAPAETDSRSVRLVLTDVPDFNSIQVANWAEAERMLRQAQMVIFVCYREAYADHRTIEELQRTCRLAGSMAYLVTKLDSMEEAEIIRNDLLSKLGSRPDFATKRADGKSLFEFFAASPFFASCRREKVQLSDFVACDGDTARPLSLSSMLMGQDAEKVLRASLLSPLQDSLVECRTFWKEARRRLDHLKGLWEQVQQETKAEAFKIADSEFPIGKFFELVVRQVESKRWTVVSVVAWPFRLAVRGLYSLGKTIVQQLSDAKKKGEIKQRHLLEKELLVGAINRLVDHWREVFFTSRSGEDASIAGELNAERIESLRQQFSETPVPVGTMLENEEVKESLKSWMIDNPWAARFFANSPDILAIVGTGLIAGDLIITGGFVGTIGGFAVSGGASLLGGYLVDLLKRTNLEKIATDAHIAWRHERERVLTDHLMTNFVEPLFYELLRQRELLEHAPIEPLGQVMDRLSQQLPRIAEESLR